MKIIKHASPAVLLLALSIGCGSSEPAAPTPAPTAPTPVPAVPAPPTASPPGMLVPGAPPTAVEVAAVPGVTFTVAAASEYQIDATGTPDVQLFLVQNGNVMQEDSDSGDGTNARLQTFLAPGTYEARVYEWHGRALAAAAQITALDPMPSTATLTPGTPQLVQAPAGEMRRAACAEVTLEVRAAGNYRIDATSDPSRDAQLLIHRDGSIVAEDSDSGDANNAQITRQLEPGSYRLRVYDWMNRDAAITVTATAL